MRGLIEGLETPRPLIEALPSLYQEDDFTSRFVSSFDAPLAPVFAALDSLDAYLDPRLAPEDFVDWLAGWLGVAVDETWPLERRRELVSRIAELYRWRGTVRGLAEEIALLTGLQPEIEDSGGTVGSVRPEVALPGAAEARVVVRLRADDPATVDRPRLDAIVESGKPAHVPATVEVLGP